MPAKIIKCNRECANWDPELRDCSLNHDVYQSMLGVIFVETCDDFEDITETDIPDYLGGSDDEYGDDDFYEEPKPRPRAPVVEQRKVQQSIRKNEVATKASPVPVRTKTTTTNGNANSNNGSSAKIDFAARAKQKMEEARRKRDELERAKARSAERDDDDEGPDPLDELRETYKKRGQGSNALADIHQFMEDVKSGKITPKQIEEEIASINKVPVKNSISEKEIEEEKERIRKQLNISAINESQKKKKPVKGK